MNHPAEYSQSDRHGQIELFERPITGETAVLAECWHRALLPAGHPKHDGWPVSLRCHTCGKRRAVVSVIYPREEAA